MIINRNNYEEYFLLYIDKELGEAERNAVEQFISENPDLKAELEALQSVILDDNEIVSFPGKKELLSTGSALLPVNTTNRTEYFIAYADNELNNTEKAAVEQFVYHHPEHQQEFELFLQTKLEADQSIIFEDKKSLYRQEATVRPIAGWLKFSAAAAAAVIFIVFGYLQYKAENDVEDGKLYSKNMTRPEKKDSAKQSKFVIPEPVLPAAEVKAQTENKDINISPAELRPEVKEAVKIPESVKQQAGEVMEAPKAAQPLEVTDFAAAEMDKASVVETDKLQAPHAGDIEIIVQYPQETLEQTTEEQLRIANIPVNDKSRLGRMIRKTSRFINKTTNLNPSIPGLKIGQFEIAVR